MNPTHEPPIAVGVNGSVGSLTAVRYAAAEAARIGCDLRIIHVAPSYLPIDGLVPVAALQVEDFEAVGRAILESSAEPAYEVLPPERITTRLRAGYRTSGLLQAARDARLLVVGDDRTRFLARIAVGEFIGSLAAATSIPMVSVPQEWVPVADPTAERRVVLAIKDPQRIPPELLRAGFEVARDRDATLEIVHVWDIPRGYGALVTSMMEDAAVQSILDRSVRAMSDSLQAEFPSVRFTTSSRYGQAAHILRALTRGATLLLIARRAHGLPAGHLGATGRAMLRESECPVEVLPMSERAGPEHHHRLTERVSQAGERAWDQRTAAKLSNWALV